MTFVPSRESESDRVREGGKQGDWSSLFDKVLQLGLHRLLRGLNHFLWKQRRPDLLQCAGRTCTHKALRLPHVTANVGRVARRRRRWRRSKRKTHPLRLQDVGQLFGKLAQALLQDKTADVRRWHFPLVITNLPHREVCRMWSTHLHHLVPGALVAQLPQAVDKALAVLAVDPAGLQHGLALLHQLPHAIHTAQGLSSYAELPTRRHWGD